MSFKIITSENFRTTNWSGGTTTELFIFPPKADFQQRNFDFRLSTAIVNIEKTNFTTLPEISRKLMVLDGEIILKHENHHVKQLHKFDTDQFEGDWKTSCEGICNDFNLMTRGNTSGELSALTIGGKKTVDYVIEDKVDQFFIYVYKGSVDVNLNNEYLTLYQGDLLEISVLTSSILQLNSDTKSELVMIKITI
jgi:uncharacterized protein